MSVLLFKNLKREMMDKVVQDQAQVAGLISALSGPPPAKGGGGFLDWAQGTEVGNWEQVRDQMNKTGHSENP